MNPETIDQRTRKLMEAEAPNPQDSMSEGEEEVFQPSAMEQSQQPEQSRMLESSQIVSEPIKQYPIKIDYSQSNFDEIEELVESVVNEKWQSLIENFGDIGLWKDRVRIEVSSIKQEILRLENRFENLQKAILGKIKSYDENIVEVGSDIKALEKVFQKILDPLTTNIKELDRITKHLKK